MITEQEIARRLQEGRVNLPPLTIQASAMNIEKPGANRMDAVIWVFWAKQRVKAAVEFKALSTPKVIREAMCQIRSAAQAEGLIPMIIVPYLSEESLRDLEREGVSGVDLCGNGIVVAPGKFSVYRAGNPNQFSSSAPIKNIYRRNSSMVGRLLLVKPRFNRVMDIMEEINARNALGKWTRQPMALSTVSKALKALEEDMIVSRDGSSTRLLQAAKLLDKLAENYVRPKVSHVTNWKLPMPSSGVLSLNEVLGEAFKRDIPAVLTGVSSVSLYAVMQAGQTPSLYCPDPEALLAKMPGARTERFPTFTVIQTEEASLYFDARREKDMVFASPVQTYLELMAGDKRDQETAQQLKESILHLLA